MADLTVLGYLEPVPVYPAMNNRSRSSFLASSPRLAVAKSPITPRVSTDSDGIPDNGSTVSASEYAAESPTEHHGQPRWTSDPSSSRGRIATPSPQHPSPYTSTFSATPSLTHGSPSSSRSHTPSLREQDMDIPIIHPSLTLASRPTRHRPTRSRSAPPERTTFDEEGRPLTPGMRSPIADASSEFGSPLRIRPQRGYSTYSDYDATPFSSPTKSVSSYSFGSRSKGGELLRPPPPLHRPYTFWRRTPRSGVTASSYSPATHVIRRSTFIAAGLPFDKPMADLSALAVETRVKHDETRKLAKVQEVFWEVVM